MAACALTGGKLSPEIDVSETSENERGCLLVFISFFRRDVDDAVSGAVVVSEVWVDDIGGFLSGLGGLIVNHLLSPKFESCVFSLFDVLKGAC
jgi:hypothetical protein